jgi:osmotically-inducible protein OsmY
MSGEFQMKKFALLTSLLLGMSTIVASAQTSPSSSPDQNSPSMSGQQQPDSTYPQSQSQLPDSSQSAASATQAQADVQKAFQQDSSLSQSGVSVQVGTNNNLVLTGTVQSQADKDHAEQVARSASGGMTVDNQIQVSGSSTTPGSDTSTTPPPQGNSFLPAQEPSSQSPDQSSQTPDQTTPTQAPDQSSQTPDQTTPAPDQGSAAGQTGSQSTTGAQTPGMASDQGMNSSQSAQSQIQAALQQQPSLSGVSVTESASEIELTGNVAKSSDKKDAKKIAEQYANGKKVVEHITVGEPK